MDGVVRDGGSERIRLGGVMEDREQNREKRKEKKRKKSLVAVAAVAGHPTPPFVVGQDGAGDDQDGNGDEDDLHKSRNQGNQGPSEKANSGSNR
jgi:hypothetical protein